MTYSSSLRFGQGLVITTTLYIVSPHGIIPGYCPQKFHEVLLSELIKLGLRHNVSLAVDAALRNGLRSNQLSNWLS
jgi:hypothetical protein